MCATWRLEEVCHMPLLRSLAGYYCRRLVAINMPLLRSLAGYWEARGYKHGAPPELGGRAVRDRRF